MKKILLLIICFLQYLITFAQNPADVGQVFGHHPEFSDSVKSLAIQPDGKILIGGIFYLYQGAAQKGLIRLNTDGTKDNSFDIGTGFGYVYSIVLQPDGKILVGGSFTNYKGNTQNRLIRLNSDGSKDTSFDIGTGFNDVIYSIALQPDGKILVGGIFTTYKGNTQNRLIRLNSDGSKDNTFDIGNGFIADVNSIAIQKNGKILIGSYGITRLNTDGSKDTSFIRIPLDITPYSIVIQPDEKILIGSSSIKDILIRLNTDGTKDTSFNIGTGFNDTIYSIVLQLDGEIILGGNFTTYQGIPQNRLIRLNTDGSKDNSFDIGTGFNNNIFTIVQQTDGQVFLGGDFTTFQGVIQNRLVHLNKNGTKDNSYDKETGLENPVKIISQQTDGKIIVGGNFTTYQKAAQNHLIRLNTDSSKDNSFDIGNGFNANVESVVSQTNGKTIVGGHFTSYRDITQNYLVRLNSNGSKDNSFDIGNGFNNAVISMAIQTDGKIIVGGWFTSYQGIPQNRLIRLNTDGSKDNSFDIGTGFNSGVTGSSVNSICIQPDGKIIIGGDFYNYNGFGQNNLIRLNTDGSKDSTFNIGTGFNDDVTTITLQSDGKIFVGGSFYIFKGFGQYRLIRLNTDGSKDSSFNIGSGATGTGFQGVIESLALQPNGQLLVGGWFTSYQNVPQNRLIRLNTDGSKDNSFDIGTGFNNTVYSILQQSNGQILVGGTFTTYKEGNQSAYLIGLKGTSTLSNENFTKDENLFSLWPNPVQNILNLNTSIDSVLGIKIYDLQGKLIYMKEKETPSIDVSNFSNGLYLMKLQTENGEISKKFIKQ